MFPHAGRYGSDNFVTPDGVPVDAGTLVTIYEANGTTVATIYADKDRGAKANPFVLADWGTSPSMPSLASTASASMGPRSLLSCPPGPTTSRR